VPSGRGSLFDDRGGGNPTNGVQAEIDVATGNCIDANADNVISDTRWYHIAFTYAANTMRIYVDGVEVSSVAGICTGSGDYVPDTNSNHNIGALGDGNNINFDGIIDEVRLYDRTLSAQEVNALYQMGR